MSVRLIAFTEKGFQLAQKLANELDGTAERCCRQVTLKDWTAEAFKTAESIIFVGAAGIAVRAIAPYVKSKVQDPAVIVVDECGNFAVPILSGHLGGANALARKISALCGALAVITTATDVNGVFAVDEWAKKQNCRVFNPERIKIISGKILAGETVYVKSPWTISGTAPDNVRLTDNNGDVTLDFIDSVSKNSTLSIVPRIAVLGIGCRKGTERSAIEHALKNVLEESGIYEEAIDRVCTIELKKDEPGLLEFCESHSFEFKTFSAEELSRVKGEFTASDFVKSVTGVDNVCERSAILGCGDNGELYVKKYAGGGVTMAIAIKPFAPDWSYYDE